MFLRPRRTLVTLISTSVGSSTALPRGEAIKFAFSANGQILLCLSSSRIFVLDLASTLITVMYELKTSRMPLAATIRDDGRVLAVVSHRHQVNIYHLAESEAKHIQVLTLNNVPRALALSPSGTVLGIAYDGSIEVYAVGENAMSSQRRAVRCGKVDALSFSSDGSLLVGSSLNNPEGGFVIITAPFPSDSVVDMSDVQSQVWTTQILFPEVVSGLGHVSLLPSHTGDDDNWIVGFDYDVNAFRAVRSKDVKTGATFFVGPTSDDFRGLPTAIPSLSPAMSPCGDLVALTFHGDSIWLYGLPDHPDVAPLETDGTIGVNGTRIFGQSSADSQPEDESSANSRRLRSKIKQPCLLIEGHEVADIPGLTAVQWVAPRHSEDDNGPRRHRLVAVASGGVTSSTLGEEAIPVDGGRIIIFDFEPSTSDGETLDLTIELGEAEPLILREQNPNLEQEVELERRRTLLHRGTVGSPRLNITERLNISRQSFPGPSSLQKQEVHPQRGSRSQTNSPEHELGDVTLFLDGPYSNTAPRSRDTIQRAATAAATHRRAQISSQEEPAENTTQIPHESDADNWVPPPPPYTRNPDAPLPDHIRQLLLASMTAPPGGVMEEVPEQVRRVQTNQESDAGRHRSPLERIGSIGSSGFLSRRWSTRRPTTASRDNAPPRPTGVGQVAQSSVNELPVDLVDNTRRSRQASLISDDRREPLTGRALQERLHRPIPPLPRVPRAEDVMQRPSILQPGISQPARQPISDVVNAGPSRLQRRSSRSGRLFGNSFRKQSTNPVLDHPETHAANRTILRTGSIATNHAFSQSSPDLVQGRWAPQRMSTVYSNTSRPTGQSGVNRARSRSEATNQFQHLMHANINDVAQIEATDERDLVSPRSQSIPNAAGASGIQQHPNSANMDDWRTRIEEWNINTINENRRKSKVKCTVM